ncbi:MAG: biphenyl 2,3-dioxygenase [Proteobacteria bacterium]|nr:MAG: biphenyl 2,3-dioxygenase [Pseudomonadota bacterium]
MNVTRSAVFAATLALIVPGSLAMAKGDLSRANPETIVIEMGTAGQRMYFKPNHLDLETGKAYKLVLRNVDKVKHEIEVPAFTEKVFTRKVEVKDHDGKMLAEIKGAIREVEVGPGGEVEWYVVPIQTGKNLEMECALPGHKQAGMHGTITIN